MTLIVETVPSALIILDRNLNITSANRAFYQTFRTSRGETEGCHIYDLGNRQWDIPALRTLLESVIPHRASVEGFEVEHDFPTIGRRTMLVNARKIFRPGDHDGFILLAIEDVSEERAARKESKRNWQLTQSIVDTIRDPLVVLENDMTIVTASKAFLDDVRDYRGGDAWAARFRTGPAPMGRACASPFDGEGAPGKQAD